MCVRAKDTWGISVPSAQHCNEPKTALEIKVCPKNTKNSRVAGVEMPMNS